MSGSFGKSKSNSNTTQLTPDQIAGYFNKLNRITGGNLNQFARTGSQVEDYEKLTPEQLKAAGGAGATRSNQVTSARDQAIQEIAADPSLSVFQKQRAKQLTNQESQDRLDAINQETEAALTSLASQENARAFDASKATAELSREDLETLARIFFGGKGSNSSSKSRSFSMSGGIGGSYSPQ